MRGESVELVESCREDSLLLKVVEQMQLQFGASFWAFEQLGIKLADLATRPENIRGDTAAKFLRWADDGKAEGYDGEKLRREVRCVLKSRQNSSSPKGS